MLTQFQTARLLSIFRESGGKAPEILAREISQCGDIPQDLIVRLVQAVMGDNRPLNTWLFDQVNKWGAQLVWIAPVRSDTPRYVWMTGTQTYGVKEVRQLLVDAQERFVKHTLIRLEQVPEPLLFVSPTAVSGSTNRAGQYEEDEFAIFQVGYRDSPVEVSDLAQRMIINTNNIVERRVAAIQRLKLLTDTATFSVKALETCVVRNAILHTEGHNQGHFVGAWKYEDDCKKNCILYEAVEEFRACLASLMFVCEMDMTEDEKDTYALSIFVTRFLGYGYDAYKLKSHRRETVREVTVGLLFFEWLVLDEVVRVIERSDGTRMDIDHQAVRKSLVKAYTAIHLAENQLVHGDVDGLRSIGRAWYAIAFPKGQYSKNALMLYNQIGVGKE